MDPSDPNSTFTSACPACGHEYRVPTTCRGRQLTCKGCGKAFQLDPAPSPPEPAAPEAGAAADAPEALALEEACLVLGKLALKHRFLGEEQLREAIAFQQEEHRQGKRSLLGSVLLRKGLITQKQLDFLLSVQMIMEARKLDRQFGEIAVKNGFTEPDHVEEALREQQRLFKKSRTVRLIGEILVERGRIEPEKRDAILVRQQRLAAEGAECEAAAAGTGPDAGEEKDPCEELFQVDIPPDGLTATVTPNRPIPDSITVDVLKAFLEKLGVIHGLAPHDELEAFLREDARTGHAFTVAQATPPQPGRDAEIHYQFDTDPLKVGTIKEGGSIDFKDRGDIPQVSKGDLLAERIPPEEGTPGVDVSGNTVPPPKPRNRKLRRGKGTALSEDGLKLYADLPGRPEITADGKVFVFSEHKVRGDVDLKSGHVDFEGDIQVSGAIQKGFHVRGGSLTANEIAGADIDIRGDVVVTGGIIGATLRVGGSLRARYAHKSRILAFGDVVLEKELIDTEVETSGAFILKGGAVFSSNVIAKKGIEAVQIGSKTSNPCLLTVGTDDRVKHEIRDFQDRVDAIGESRKALQEAITALDQEKQQIALELGNAAQEQDALNVKKRQILQKTEEAQGSGNQNLLEKLQEAARSLEREMQEREETLEGFFAREDALDEEMAEKKREIEKMESEVEDLKGEIEHLNDWAQSEEPIPVVKVFGSLFPYTVIKGPHTSLTLPEGHKGIRIRETHYEEPEDGKEWKLKLSHLKT